MTHETNGLELISRPATGGRRDVALLFVHGINLGAWVWDAHFLDHFAAAGFDAHAVSLRGHGGSAGADRIGDLTLTDYVNDLRQTVARIGRPVVLVGHSMGGAVVQKFIQTGGRAAGMALLASVPPWGLAGVALRLALFAPRHFRVMLDMSMGRMPPDDLAVARDILFRPDMPDAELAGLTARMGPESPHIGMALQGWPPIAPLPFCAPPTFVLGGAADALIPADEVWRTGLYYGSCAELIPGLPHMVMLGEGWDAAAARLGRWLDRVA
ncbi:alpha/beta hydrolase [Paracoccus sp. (in: a-proteobacteria)]|uniref:alpha/beta hydrolase n=1 Tax=Paracoccus sp. TaxID=267 RepID=UPI0026DF407A|nr:alpha/beta fold hydrolase [Paracoccus sp. (in: a-proteobacteria)]MDO5647169.1 alpha/beta fold hydrolase [Paracoccus sp. (in: a-proteobacteria)]